MTDLEEERGHDRARGLRMNDFESKGGHEHIRARGFEALDAKSTWSSFDEITWDDFGGDDHSVPEPDEPTVPSLWLRRKKDSKLWKEVKEESLSKMDADTSTMDVDSWDSLNVVELGAVPDNLTTMDEQEAPEVLSSLAGGVGLYNDDDSSIVSSGHFSFSAAPSEEEMTLFGGENGTEKGSSILGYAWENLEDMDNLFQNEETQFGADAADALLQWPASSLSPDSASGATTAKACASPELRAMKGKSHDRDMKMEFIPCESFEKSTEACTNSAEAEKTVTYLSNTEMDFSASEGQLVTNRSDMDKTPQNAVDPLLSPKGKQQVSDADKAHTGKRPANRKRSDERSKKQIYSKRPGITHSKQQPLIHYSSSQPLQLKQAVASTLQVYPQVIGPPVIHHRPQYLHPSYLMQPGQVQHPQAIMMCYEHADAHPQHQEPRQTLELLTPPPPASGSNMTPQEKIEKLRWKQKMHRLASEQHQQMAKQCAISIDAFPQPLSGQDKTPLDTENKSGSPSVVVKSEEGDEARTGVVENAILGQLLSIMSKLDVGARICIRDALYRLARSAMSRHASDGPSSSEGSNNSASDNTLSKAIRYPLLETETNPIDRTIANLLFHKRSTSNSTNSSNSTGSVVNISCRPDAQAQAQTPAQAPWAWQAGVSPPEATTPDGNRLRAGLTDYSSENAEEVSGRHAKLRAVKSSLHRSHRSVPRKREGEFLSNQEDSRGTSSSSSDSSRDLGKAARIQ